MAPACSTPSAFDVARDRAGQRTGLGHGDRAVFLGTGQRRGKHCDVLAVRPPHASVRFDDVGGTLCLAEHLHPIPRRPPPDF